MSYYHQPTSTERGPGRIEMKLSDGYPLGPPDSGWTPELAALCGFVVVTNTARPADTPTVTTDRTLVVIAQVPTVVWTTRPKTLAETAADVSQTNTATIRTQAATALAVNTAYLAISTPTTAQAVAQTKALTRQLSGLIRLTINQLDATD